MSILHRAAVLAASLATLALAGCGGDSAAAVSSSAASPVQAATALGKAAAVIKATDDLKFAPSTTSVKTGQIVEFDNTGAMAHEITFDTAPDANLASFPAGGRWQVEFSAAGTYTFQCTFHPGMTGTLTVTS